MKLVWDKTRLARENEDRSIAKNKKMLQLAYQAELVSQINEKFTRNRTADHLQSLTITRSKLRKEDQFSPSKEVRKNIWNQPSKPLVDSLDSFLGKPSSEVKVAEFYKSSSSTKNLTQNHLYTFPFDHKNINKASSSFLGSEAPDQSIEYTKSVTKLLCIKESIMKTRNNFQKELQKAHSDLEELFNKGKEYRSSS